MTTPFLKKLAELDEGQGEHDALYTAGLLYENRAAIRELVEAADHLINSIDWDIVTIEHFDQYAAEKMTKALAAFKGE